MPRTHAHAVGILYLCKICRHYRHTGAALKNQILGIKQGDLAAQEPANLKFCIEFYGMYYRYIHLLTKGY